MQSFTQKIVQMMKSERLFASQGGPIILSQVWILESSPLAYVIVHYPFIRIPDYILSLLNGIYEKVVNFVVSTDMILKNIY